MHLGHSSEHDGGRKEGGWKEGGWKNGEFKLWPRN